VPAGADTEAVQNTAERALARHELVTDGPASAYRLTVTIAGDAAKQGVRSVRCDLTLFKPDGTSASFPYESVAGEVTPRSYAALIDAAVDAHASELAALMVPAGTASMRQ
jgi:hypothetical protein